MTTGRLLGPIANRRLTGSMLVGVDAALHTHFECSDKISFTALRCSLSPLWEYSLLVSKTIELDVVSLVGVTVTLQEAVELGLLLSKDWTSLEY